MGRTEDTIGASGMEGRRSRKGPRCGHPVRLGPCALRLGHPGSHRSLKSPSSSLERVRQRVRQSNRNRLGFSLTEAEEVALYQRQGGCCAICGVGRQLHGLAGLYADHDHRTGKVRALLCPSCNGALGAMRDDPSLLRQAAGYLERFQSQSHGGPAEDGAPSKESG